MRAQTYCPISPGWGIVVRANEADNLYGDGVASKGDYGISIGGDKRKE